MSRHLQELVENCSICNQYKMKQQKEPLHQHPIPYRPWQRVGTDIFEHAGEHYLILSDYYSNYFEMTKLKSMSAINVINITKT